MKLSLPEVKVTSEHAFDQRVDIFSRRAYGEQLTRFIKNTDENLVFALDSNWGEGKTTFIKMWKKHNETLDPVLKTIYFDAFENDYQQDPFLALASEVYELLEDTDEEKRQDFKDKASNVFKAFSRGLIKTGVRVGTAGVIDGSTFDSVGQEVSSLVADQVDSVIADKFESSRVDKKALKEFRDFLTTIVDESTEDKKLVFIIDELDRCRPDFALDILEKIKHLFSVPGLTFVLVMNREQLEESVKSRYGNGINASLYLQKFINVWLTLPRVKTDGSNNHSKLFFNYAVDLMGSTLLKQNQVTARVFKTLISNNATSFREIERMLTYFAVLENVEAQEWTANYQLIFACVCYLKVAEPLLIKSLLSKRILATEVHDRLNISPHDNDMATQSLANLISASLCTKGELATMVEQKLVRNDNFYEDEFDQNMFQTACNLLDSFSVS
ncbi:P-loop NTPase fold protein [Vibrio splendidus]|uniref:KAP family P-loop NTPase fold protein n=1 Tax=Vibrio sp. 10N.222.54.B11 TaxID=3229635 RepID=UPI003552AA7C